jgi:hypothetical protein
LTIATTAQMAQRSAAWSESGFERRSSREAFSTCAASELTAASIEVCDRCADALVAARAGAMA